MTILSSRRGARLAPLAVLALFIGGCSSCFPSFGPISCIGSPARPAFQLESDDGEAFTGGEVIITLSEASPDRVEIVASAVAGRRFWALQGYAPLAEWQRSRITLDLVRGEPGLGTAASSTRDRIDGAPVRAGGGTVSFVFASVAYVSGELAPSDGGLSGSFGGAFVTSCWVFDRPGSDVLVEAAEPDDQVFCGGLKRRGVY